MDTCGNKSYIFYGAVSRIYYTVKRAEDFVMSQNGTIICYVDSDRKKWGDTSYPGVLGNGVESPEILLRYPDATIVILCSHIREVVKYIKHLGINNEILAYPFFRYNFIYSTEEETQNCANWMLDHEDTIRELYEEDIETKRILNSICKQRKMKGFSFASVEEMYDFEPKDYFFDESIRPVGNITFIDGGAFTGDSIEALYSIYGNDIKKIYAFEPDRSNMKKLERNLEKLRLSAISEYIHAGMGDKDGTLYIVESNDYVSHITEEGNIPVMIQKIDSIVKDVQGTLCIKMDIEGLEVKAIEGARNVIKKYKPYMAICVYHKVSDILEVPEKIKAICPDYKFFLRAGTHTECYAVPM